MTLREQHVDITVDRTLAELDDHRTRIGELARDPFAWFAIAAVAWLLAFGPWVVQLARTYLAPRVDSKPG